MASRKTNNKNKPNRYLPNIKRRDFLRGSASGMAGAWMSTWPWQQLAAQQALNPVVDDWDSGQVRHLLPAVNESQLLIKASFTSPVAEMPQLRIRNGASSRVVNGYQNDTGGEFWQFQAAELQSDTEYQLSLQDSRGNQLC